MKLSNLEFIRLLPQFMRDDAAVKGLSAGIDSIIPQLAESLQYLSTWDHIDELPEAELDDLAWELNILWYDYAADIEAKRDVIKNSDKVYQSLGTKWAVESVVKSYFGDGHIEEWFDYDGEPGRFRVHSTNPSITGEQLGSFLALVRKVKRASAKLEAIILELESTGAVSFGAASEMSGSMDVWPLVVREVEAAAVLSYGIGGEMSERMSVHPLAAKEIDARGTVYTSGGMAYSGPIEIFPYQ